MSLNLTTHYGGLCLRSPIIVGACPLTADEQTRRSFEEAGAGAIVLPSLFEEQVVRWAIKTDRPVSQRERELLNRSNRYYVHTACQSAECYLALVNRAATYSTIPVIASLNGYTDSGWLDFAGELEEAGAAAIELNVHHGPVSDYTGAIDLENSVVDAISEIKQSITVPLFIKLERGGLSIPHLARRICSGADGLVMYGRQPNVDICLDSFKLNSHWSLTQPGRVVDTIGHIMQVHGHCPAMSIAASAGVASSEDVIKVLLAGADVAMVTSEVYRNGADTIRRLLDGLIVFLEKHHLRSLDELHELRPLEFGSEEERSTYTAALSVRLTQDPPVSESVDVKGDAFGHITTP
ncbi:Dihydroorotate dehydrogenase B (NAD(+)), catalytic subunit [Rubripirellula amarantea]|uniref:Dihydroorotate dehydrogenase B (NAD(+)), catalytic subunit n=1 Tax=Rubripirellula amarantea TaxID=2527999 RepID=A0A5C5WM53_9BACT|nr:dihydroorotate dehydrogenase [Rubripirellula amarantea]TWT51245.1 Dihydroorotate dehydrogenase B (NAD(+)), catalytic subunit [Rubripirellula amarantea]